MLWIEMSRDFEHGGGSWGFALSLWSPTRKKAQNGQLGGASKYWENLLKVRQEDVVLHLREEKNTIAFVGYSLAATDGEKTAERPPHPGVWGYDTHFYRVLLKDFHPFPSPLVLDTFFRQKEDALCHYFEENKQKPPSEKKTLFYVLQNGQLQRQNGAYLSEVDEILEPILLGTGFISPSTTEPELVDVATREQIVQLRTRVGQQAFAEKVRANYHMQCCFPDCSIVEARFLIGSHIARWADVPALRGRLNNGFCFCLLHDKAFEIGMFTVDKHFCIQINRIKEEVYQSQWCRVALIPYEGQPIRHGDIPPSLEALQHHWRRINIESISPLRSTPNSA